MDAVWAGASAPRRDTPGALNMPGEQGLPGVRWFMNVCKVTLGRVRKRRLIQSAVTWNAFLLFPPPSVGYPWLQGGKSTKRLVPAVLSFPCNPQKGPSLEPPLTSCASWEQQALTAVFSRWPCQLVVLSIDCTCHFRIYQMPTLVHTCRQILHVLKLATGSPSLIISMCLVPCFIPWYLWIDPISSSFHCISSCPTSRLYWICASIHG